MTGKFTNTSHRKITLAKGVELAPHATESLTVPDSGSLWQLIKSGIIVVTAAADPEKKASKTLSKTEAQKMRKAQLDAKLKAINAATVKSTKSSTTGDKNPNTKGK